MKSLLFPAAILSILAVAPLSAQTYYEPFPYEPGMLSGAGDWTGEEDQGSITVMPGSLNYEGLAASQKNRARFPSTQSKVHDATAAVSGLPSAPWFSFLIRVDKAEGLGLTKEGKQGLFGIFRIGKSGGPNGPGLYLKPSAGSKDQYVVAASKRANPEKTVMAPAGLPVGKPHLVVGHYNTQVTPHRLDIWLNPPMDTFGADQAPDATFSTADGTDFTAVFDAVILGGGVGSTGVLMDEIRIGQTWAEVTPH